MMMMRIDDDKILKYCKKSENKRGQSALALPSYLALFIVAVFLNVTYRMS